MAQLGQQFKETIMTTKPLNENLEQVRIVTEDGELIPVMDAAGAKFTELINAVVSRQKPGTLTLKIQIKPSTAGAMAIKADIATKKPQGIAAESLLWATPEGNLISEDPRQIKLDLKPVTPEPKRELKAVTK